MSKYLILKLFLLFFFLITLSCRLEDLNPDEVSNEITISCQLTDLNQPYINFKDTTIYKDVWVTSSITKGCADRQFDYYGQCWTYNSDNLPTINSEMRRVPWEKVTRGEFRETKEGLPLYNYNVIRSGIPVSNSDTKIIVRGFVIFNNSIIRYSEPLELINPIQYAN